MIAGGNKPQPLICATADGTNVRFRPRLFYLVYDCWELMCIVFKTNQEPSSAVTTLSVSRLLDKLGVNDQPLRFSCLFLVLVSR